jgi:hypothetical protein
VTVNSATTITAVAPAEAAGTVDVTVTSSTGTSATSSADKYTYLATNTPVVTKVLPPSGKAFSLVLIEGRNLTNIQAVYFGSTAHPALFLGSSSSMILALAPSEPAGTTVDVTVKTRAGTSATSSADRFTYLR